MADDKASSLVILLIALATLSNCGHTPPLPPSERWPASPAMSYGDRWTCMDGVPVDHQVAEMVVTPNGYAKVWDARRENGIYWCYEKDAPK